MSQEDQDAEYTNELKKKSNIIMIPIDENSTSNEIPEVKTQSVDAKPKRRARLSLDVTAAPKKQEVDSKASEVVGPKSALLPGQQRTRTYGLLRINSAGTDLKSVKYTK